MTKAKPGSRDPCEKESTAYLAAAGKKKVKAPADTAGSSVDKKGKQPKKKN